MMASEPCVLAIDVGSTRCKASLVTLDGRVRRQHVVDCASYFPEPEWVEQDALELWQAVAQATASLADLESVRLLEIAAVVVTGQMHGVVGVNDGGEPTTRFVTLRDHRAALEAGLLAGEINDGEFWSITGSRLDATSAIAKLLWFHRNLPEKFAETSAFIPIKDFIRLRMTGILATDPIDAAGMLLMDIHQGAWDPNLARLAELPLSKLPPILRSYECAGTVTEPAAQALRLRKGVPVVVGAGDDIEFLGLGLLDPGDALEHLGTTGTILSCVSEPPSDVGEGKLEVYPHVLSDRWLIGGSTSNAGSALAWASKVLSTTIQPATFTPGQSMSGGPLVFLPYLTGERCPVWNPEARGMFFGLSIAHQKEDLAQSALEGVAFSLRHTLEALERAGVEIRQLRIADSGHDSVKWRRLRASVYGRPLVPVETPDPTALGAVQLASVALGAHDSLSDAVKSTVRQGDEIDPDETWVPALGERYALFVRLSESAQTLYGLLSESKSNRFS